ncbi:MAG: hypothetical protein M5U19_01345 [Microthrixaceae bacterium]|nr:hypothetical protein [Microthrixaceae bacterium]
MLIEPSGRESLRVGLCQINTVVGDLTGNAERVLAGYERAEAAGADVALFPELAITGYPPEDLLLKPGFLSAAAAAMQTVVDEVTGHCTAVVGWVEGRLPQHDESRRSSGPFNAAAVIQQGRLVHSYRKQALPNYGVFDEQRYFEPGSDNQPLYRIGGVVVGVSVCEDIWVREGPTEQVARDGARLILNINASPFCSDRQSQRQSTVTQRVRRTGVPVVYVNQVGAQDDLIFDGGSMAVTVDGPLVRARRFVEDSVVVDVPLAAETRPRRHVVEVSEPSPQSAPRMEPAGLAPSPEGLEELWEALCLGTADYVSKNGFSEVVVGLSGGVDSALVAAIATDALGSANTHVVLMPSRFSSDHSVEDATRLASNLNLDARTIP